MSINIPFILAIDKDRSYAIALESAFKTEGYSYRHVDTYQHAQAWLIDPQCQAVVIGRNLEGGSGLQLARILRNESPTSKLIIILIAHSYDEYDVIESLEAGVDDYMGKPLGSRELVCRFKAISRGKVGTKLEVRQPDDCLGTLTVNGESATALVDGKLLKLTRSEFEILQRLIQSPGRVFSRTQLMNLLSISGNSPRSSDDDRKIHVHIGRIRSELSKFENAPVIQTVRGEGYCISEMGSNGANDLYARSG
jgi:two-component system, OmpR family, phosphate regulon response regulator PhoB